MLDQVQALQGLVERIVRFLMDRSDEPGVLLRHEGRGLLCAAKIIESAMVAGAERESDLDELRSLVERGRALLDKTRRYAGELGLPFLVVPASPLPGSPETHRFTEVELRALIAGMPPGATEPPPRVAEAALEAQMLGRYSTVPSPPPSFAATETTKV